MSFGSMYVGATGVVAHNTRMQVVSNNLANVSTIGFKRADALFGDLISQQLGSGSATYESGAHYVSQIGKGVAVSDIRTIFTDGALETTNTVTDLALSGEGFFGVNDPNGAGGTTGPSHYTRAGAFRFNNDAYLVDAHGYRLQGYAIDPETGELAAAASDVQLPYEDVVINGETTRLVRSDPFATTSVEVVTNLDHTAADLFSNGVNPFFSLLSAYQANQSNASTPFGGELPAYSTAISVYDEAGNNHDMTIYFDPVASTSLSNAVPGYSYWEFLIAMPEGSDASSAYGTSAAGLAGMGVLTFNSQGELIDMAAYSLNPTGTSAAAGTSLGAWTPATFSAEGLPQFAYTFGSNGGAVGEMSTISYDFGISSTSGSWLGSGGGTAAAIGNDASNLFRMADMDRDARVTTSYDSPSATLYHLQDGYGWGYLNYLSVSREGVMSGHFTNGQTEELYQVAVYRFNSPWGLRRDGQTNFVATEASGAAMAGVAGDRGRGYINQNSLEESNVDMAQEFANMIVTQRGYQANTKVITTADTLLNTLISVKR